MPFHNTDDYERIFAGLFTRRGDSTSMPKAPRPPAMALAAVCYHLLRHALLHVLHVMPNNLFSLYSRTPLIKPFVHCAAHLSVYSRMCTHAGKVRLGRVPVGEVIMSRAVYIYHGPALLYQRQECKEVIFFR